MNNTTHLLDIIEKNQKKLNDASEQIRVLRDYDPLINTDIRMTPYEIGKDISRCEKTIIKCRKRITSARNKLKASEIMA